MRDIISPREAAREQAEATAQLAAQKAAAEAERKREADRPVGTPSSVGTRRPRTQTEVPPVSAVAPVKTSDDWTNRLLNQIPTPVIAAYLTIDGIIRAIPDEGLRTMLLWIVFFALLIATPLYATRIAHVTLRPQIIIATGAYVVWVISLGGPFATFSWFHPAMGSILLVLYTLFAAIAIPDKEGLEIAKP